MSLFWIELWIGFFIVMSLLAVAIMTSSFRPITRGSNDQDALQITKETLDNDGIEYYEVTSITPIDDTDVTTVIVHTGTMEIALEIDNNSGKLISKERIAR